MGCRGKFGALVINVRWKIEEFVQNTGGFTPGRFSVIKVIHEKTAI